MMDPALMTQATPRHTFPSLKRGSYVIVGGFGSGKSEVSVNLARHLVGTKTLPVALADLDIINPYFRSREAAKQLADMGVRLLVPPGAQAQADRPIIIPEIKGSIQSNDGYLILDAGGDDLGARVLASLRDAFEPGEYEMLLVLNKNRPFTATVDGARQIVSEIETASGLRFSGIISNTHLIEYTTPEGVIEGMQFAKSVSGLTGLPVRFVCALTEIIDRIKPDDMEYPDLPLQRSLLKPWERSSEAEE